MASGEGDASEPILEIDHVSRRFGQFLAVDDVSIAVRRGEFLTFLGPSGCGKTTLLRIIAGFESASAGEVRIAGRSMTGVKPYRRPVGIVFQNLALFPHLSVGDNVAFGLAARRTDPAQARNQVAEVLSLVELAGTEGRRIHELSGGQKQRVALARALVLRPEVLLLDEPLGALDLKLRRQLQYELKEIQRRVGTTFLFVTHDQEEALTMSDRIAVINRGKLEQLDDPEAIYRNPASTFVARFIGDTNLLEATVRAPGLGGFEVGLPGIGGAGFLRLDSPLSSGERILLSVRPEHVRIGAAAGPDSASVRGRVLGRSYVGANTRYVVDVAGTSVIALQSNAESGQCTFRPQDEVLLGIDLDHAALVPDATAAPGKS